MHLNIDIAIGDIGLIKDLWEANRIYHSNTSKYFGNQYRSIHFEERMKALSGFDKDTLKITVAKDGDDCIGYCISTIVDGRGELLSMHVLESRRGNGVGKELAIGHIVWMREKHCKEINVTVSHENESTVLFYQSIGFFPDTVQMKQME